MLNLLVYDSGLKRHYSVRMRNYKSVGSVLDWVKSVRIMPAVQQRTSVAIYESTHPPFKDRLSKAYPK